MRGAFGKPGVPFLLSRRAHLLTTHEVGGGIAYGNRALCEADAAPAGALCPMPQSCGIAVIVHAVGLKFCFIRKTGGWRFATPSPSACDKAAGGRFVAERVSQFTTPFFSFCEKETKSQERKDDENEWQSIIWKPRWSAGELAVLLWQLLHI